LNATALAIVANSIISISDYLLWFLLRRLPPISQLFPYTTLFRSRDPRHRRARQRRDARLRGDRALLRRRRHRPCTFRAHVLFCRSEEHTSELQSRENIVCRLLLEKKKYILACYVTLVSNMPLIVT